MTKYWFLRDLNKWRAWDCAILEKIKLTIKLLISVVSVSRRLILAYFGKLSSQIKGKIKPTQELTERALVFFVYNRLHIKFSGTQSAALAARADPPPLEEIECCVYTVQGSTGSRRGIPCLALRVMHVARQPKV